MLFVERHEFGLNALLGLTCSKRVDVKAVRTSALHYNLIARLELMSCEKLPYPCSPPENLLVSRNASLYWSTDTRMNRTELRRTISTRHATGDIRRAMLNDARSDESRVGKEYVRRG